MREGEVHADSVLEHEGFAVLPDDTGADAALLKLAYCDAVLAAPVGAVEIEHVRPLRTHHADAFEVIADEIAGVFVVRVDDAAHLVRPFLCAEQRVQREHVAVVIMADLALPHDAVTQVCIINNMVAADKPREGEGFARRVERHRALARVRGDGLCRDITRQSFAA